MLRLLLLSTRYCTFIVFILHGPCRTLVAKTFFIKVYANRLYFQRKIKSLDLIGHVIWAVWLTLIVILQIHSCFSNLHLFNISYKYHVMYGNCFFPPLLEYKDMQNEYILEKCFCEAWIYLGGIEKCKPIKLKIIFVPNI